MRKYTRRAIVALAAILTLMLGLASPASALPGSWGSTGNVAWKHPTVRYGGCVAPTHFMASYLNPNIQGICGIGTWPKGEVYIIDQTPTLPVHSAVDTINSYLNGNSNMFELVYIYGPSIGATCASWKLRPCVDVIEHNYIADNHSGNVDTEFGYAANLGTAGACTLANNPGVVLYTAAIQGYSATVQRSIVMHELYHSIGLGHTVVYGDIMYAAFLDSNGNIAAGMTRGSPSVNDSSNVNRLYGRYYTNTVATPCL